MFSGKKHLLRRRQAREPWPRTRRWLFPKLRRKIQPRVGIQVWLTALFMLVTAFAGITAYELVRPILSSTLQRSNEAYFSQVGDRYEELLSRRGGDISIQRIKSFAATQGLQWGIVRASDQSKLRGSNALEWDTQVVKRAVNSGEPKQEIESIETGARTGRRLATYAAPINLPGEKNTAVVFSRYFLESELNAAADVRRINRIAFLAGILALLIAGFSGYVVATLISRRVSRLGLAAERLAAGNFDERIETRIEDEVGSLGETFNSMAASLQGAFQQVEQEKERGRAILDGMTDAVVGVNSDLNAIFLNPRARELLDSSDHDFHTRLQEILARATRDGPVTEPEVEAGNNRLIEIRAAPLEDGALAILRDVTEERRVQRAKAEFIANASHELKTPLFALSGYLEMLEDEDDEEVRSGFLEEMRSQTGRLQNLARTLLDLSRLDANAVTFRLEEVDLADLLYELRQDFGYTGRSVNVHAEESVPLVVTDPTQLHRMLAILLDNALKYSNEDLPVDLTLSREDGHAVISVSDRGCGIPEEELPHIFDRFYRAQGSSRADGTGLGLALASEITGHLHGEIQVESQTEQGSTFSVILPLPEDSDESHNGQTE